MPEYTGLYRASVYSVSDPEQRGRIRALIPQVLGESPSGWAEPTLLTKTTANLRVKDRVWILFEGGDINRPTYLSRMEVLTGDLDDGISTDIQEAVSNAAEAIEAVGDAESAAAAATIAAQLATEAAENATAGVDAKVEAAKQAAISAATEADEILQGDINAVENRFPVDTPDIKATAIDSMTITGATYRTSATATTNGLLLTNGGIVAYGDSKPTFTVNASTGKVTTVGAALIGGTATALTFQTSEAEATGVKLTPNGLVGYAAASTPSNPKPAFSLGIDGALYIDGSVNSARVFGARITGSTLETHPEDLVGVKITSGGLIGYGADKTPTFTLDAVTGTVSATGKVVATGLTVVGNMSVRKDNNFIEGKIVATAQVQNPAVAMDVTFSDAEFLTTYPNVSAGGFKPTHSTLHPLDSTRLVIAGYIGSNPGSPFSYSLRSLNLTTGAVSSYAMNNYGSIRGITSNRGTSGANGDTIFVLADNSEISPNLVAYKLSGTYLPVTGAGTFYDMGSIANYDAGVSLGWDYVNSRLLVSFPGDTRPDSDVYVLRINPTNMSSGGYTLLPGGLGSTTVNGLNSLDFGQFDIGSSVYRLVTSETNGTVRTIFWNSSTPPARSIAYDYTWNANGSHFGTVWNGTDFTAFTNFNRVTSATTASSYRLGRNPTTEYLKGGYTWYDGDTSGSTQTHETRVGGDTVILRTPRTILTLKTPPAPASGVVDTNYEKANRTGLYLAVGTQANYASLDLNTAGKRQIQQKSNGYSTLLTGGVTDVTWKIVEKTTTNGSTPPTTNGFDSVASVGSLQSQLLNPFQSLGWSLKGDGTAQFGALVLGVDGNLTFNNLVGTFQTGGLTSFSGWSFKGDGSAQIGKLRVGSGGNINIDAQTQYLVGPWFTGAPSASQGFTFTLDQAYKVKIGVSPTAYASGAGTVGSVIVVIDGTALGQTLYYHNTAADHRTYPTYWNTITLAAGTHRIALRTNGSALSDNNDFAGVSFDLLPA